MHAHLPPVADQRRPLPDCRGDRRDGPGDRPGKLSLDLLKADARGERDDMLVPVHHRNNLVEDLSHLLRPNSDDDRTAPPDEFSVRCGDADPGPCCGACVPALLAARSNHDLIGAEHPGCEKSVHQHAAHVPVADNPHAVHTQASSPHRLLAQKGYPLLPGWNI